MSKITKKQLQESHNKLLNQFASLVRELKVNNVIDDSVCPTFTKKTEPKQLDQSVFDGLDEGWQFAAVDDDGRSYAFMRKPEIDETDPCFIDGDTTRCKLVGEGYDASNWQNSLIEREKKELLEVDLSSELTGSELCKAMLARGDKCVLIRMGVRDDKQAKDIGRFAIATSIDESGRFNVMSDQQPISKVDFAVPINNQGEPLTASEVGL